VTIFFRSYDDAYRDVDRWQRHLPEISAVAGVPRSGLHIAAMLGMIRHIPVIPIEQVLGALEHPYRPNCSRKLVPKPGPIMVVDDTSWGGYVMSSLSETLPHEVIRAALYASRNSINRRLVHHAGYIIPCRHHTFAWNCFLDAITPTLATDLDGVIAEDYHGPDETTHEAEYLDWMRTTTCLLRPLKPVQAIVTARIEKYRSATEEWLQRHGIRFNELWMRPDYNVRDVVAWKSQVYRIIANRVSTYVESEDWLASQISERTRFSTISWKRQRAYRSTQAARNF